MTAEMSPSLRQKQQELSKELTKEVILRGLAEVIIEDGPHAFSVQAVADRAGVSHRTVYRYFPSREELLAGLSIWVDTRLAELGLPSIPDDAAQIPASLPGIFATFDEEYRMVQALSMVGQSIQTDARRLRTKAFRERIRDIAPDLDDREFDETFAVIRSIASSQQWFTLREQFGISGERSGAAAAHAVRVLMDDLVARNKAALRKRGEG